MSTARHHHHDHDGADMPDPKIHTHTHSITHRLTFDPAGWHAVDNGTGVPVFRPNQGRRPASSKEPIMAAAQDPKNLDPADDDSGPLPEELSLLTPMERERLARGELNPVGKADHAAPSALLPPGESLLTPAERERLAKRGVR